ncbi:MULTISPECIES: toxin-antitoxin system HicB family antitoxin [unclassified Psychrobacter]
MYDGETLPELQMAFEAAVDEYLEMCVEENKCPNRPCSGSFNIRMPEELHRQCINEANILGLNLNKFINQCIDFYFYNKELKINYALVDLEPMQYMFTESIHYNLIPSGKETAPVYDVDMQPNSLC